VKLAVAAVAALANQQPGRNYMMIRIAVEYAAWIFP
jgi:hypothetical protein